jgi:hypothetical protein
MSLSSLSHAPLDSARVSSNFSAPRERHSALTLLFGFALLIQSPALVNAQPKSASVVGASATFSTLGPSVVTVSGRQLIVRKRNLDGTLATPAPYIVKGLDWSPASKTTNTSATDPNNASVRRAEFANWYLTDIPMFQAMNVNTVRLNIDPGLDNTALAVLDLLYSNGIMAIVTVDNAVNDTARLSQVVPFLKNHPAVLMWMLGNEWNINSYYGAANSVADAANRTQTAAALVKTMDTNHPVSTSYGDIDINSPGLRLSDTAHYVNDICTSVDVWSLNIYRGSSFGTVFDQWGSISGKPMYIGEFGTDAFNELVGPGVVDETMQAHFDLCLWNELFGKLSARDPNQVSLGGAIFEWDDEWWKVPPPSSQDTGGFASGGHPDNFANEEYFGIVDIDRHARLAYQIMTAAFDSNYLPLAHSIVYGAVSRGAVVSEYPYEYGVSRFYSCGRAFYEARGGGFGRGFNVVVIDPVTGNHTQQNFDTWADSSTGTAMNAMIAYLKSLAVGTTLMISVADEAGLTNNPCTRLPYSWTEAGLQTLEALGSRQIRSYCYWDSWAMIAVKGEGVARDESLGHGAPASVKLVIAPPTLSIGKTHVGNFMKGQTGAIYTVTVSNGVGTAPTTGTVTVTETLPGGLTLVSMAGNGWTCASTTCTRSDSLAAGASYPSIIVTVNVTAIANSPQVNSVSVSGGGSVAANAIDSTLIGAASMSLNRSRINFGFNGSIISSPQTIAVTFSGGPGLNWTASSNQANITVTPLSGTGNGTIQISAAAGSSGIVTVTAPNAVNSPQTVQVNVANATSALPFGSFDTPLNNTTGVVGAIPVTGWALDLIEVTRVDILREPVTGEPQGSLIPIGSGVFVADARPDVQGTFPSYPFSYRAGWGYQMLTNFLPNSSGSGAPGNGAYKLHAIAFNKSGNQLDLGTRTIVVDNAHAAKPFGTIDTPGQGGTISGADSVNFGWALTPQPAMIPTDGSTITVVIDGVPAAHPVYNQFRSDIASLFPGYANSTGAVGFYHMNTTTLANGVHTISWNAFDNLGRGEGLGSRYFNVLNTGGSLAAPEDVIPADAVPPDADGGYSVTIEEVGRLELPLGAARGNMLVEGEAHALPIGSTLKGGVFYWQPGPGFLGEYTMRFERPDGSRIPVRVNIAPKRY